MLLKVRILNWEKCLGRKGIDNPRWFSFQKELMSDPKYMGRLNPGMIAAFCYCCCHALGSEEGIAEINLIHAVGFTGMNEVEFRQAVIKLSEIQMLHTDVQPVYVARTPMCTVLQDKTRQNTERAPEFDLPSDPETEQRVYDHDHESVPLPAEPALPKLALLWNANRNPLLAEVKLCNSTRRKHAANRWKEHPSDEFWLEVISLINASHFCTGRNNRGWKADFDFLARPETAAKVLEGKYSNNANGTPPGGGQGPQKRPNTWFKKQQEGSVE